MAPIEPPQLRDLTPPRRRRLPVVVDDSPLYDMLMAMWSVFGGDDKVAAHDLGKRWFDQFRQAVPAETVRRIEELADAGMPWVPLVGWLAETPDPHDPESLIARLSAADPVELRRALLDEVSWSEDEETRQRAAEGDEGAIEAVLAGVRAHGPQKKATARGVERFLRFPPEKLAPALSTVVRQVWETAFDPFRQQWEEAYRRSGDATRRLAESESDPVVLIDRVTNGISYEIPLGITRLVLIPAVTLRPWTLVTEYGTSLIVVYPVADDHLSADPDAPPGWLVRVWKALGDERRLRMLRRLAEGEATLSDLAAVVGLAKSTVHHHLGVLRGAGLVRVRVGGDDKVFSLRRDALPEAFGMLDEYLAEPGLPAGRGVGS